MDRESAVPAAKSGHVEAHRYVSRRQGDALDRQGDLRGATSGASHEQDAVVLRIKIQHGPPREQPAVQVGGAGESRLFVDGEQEFERPVDQAGIIGRGHCRRHADAVVGAQRRVLGHHPFSVDADLDLIAEEIKFGRFVLLGHHVDVPLQDDRLGLLVARRRGHHDADIADLILARLEAALLGPGENVRAHLFLMARGPRDPAQLIEMIPEQLRFEIGERTGGHGDSWARAWLTIMRYRTGARWFQDLQGRPRSKRSRHPWSRLTVAEARLSLRRGYPPTQGGIMKRNIGIGSLFLLSVTFIPSPGLAADRSGPPRPPQEAVDACKGLVEGDACTVSFDGHTMEGICRLGPDGQGPLACAPKGPPPGPPPEAFAACKGLAEGDACTVSFDGHTMEGICRSGPDGKEALACAPNGPPPAR